MNPVVVTGVSSGIGWGTVKVLIGRGVRVFGSVRTQADADRLQAEFGELFTPLIFDVTDEAAVRAAAEQVRGALNGERLGGLVNNAGVAVPAALAGQPLAEFRQQLEVNLTGPLAVTQAFLPLLGTDPSLVGPPGRIVNVSSVGARLSPPFLGAYVASKAGLEALSASLRRELLLYGIDVIVVVPGAVRSAIWDKAEAGEAARPDSGDYAPTMRRFAATFINDGRAGFPPERVGEAIWTALSAARPRLRYEVVPRPLTGWVLPRALPARMLDRIIGRQLGLLRPPA